MPQEFTLIHRYFNKAKYRRDVDMGIGDDCALVQIPPQHQLAITTDSFIENIHFPKNAKPEDIGYKALAVNLSDLAAMGATPAWVTLALTMPAVNETWLQNFCHGFFQLLNQYDMQLIGGDTCRGPLAITISAYGFVPHDQALKRNGAKPGDKIYVTGTLGDAALALQALQGKLPSLQAQRNNDYEQLQQKLNYPQPCIALGLALRGIASAAIDISDGLIADLGHILTASQVGARINLTALPQSKAVTALIKAGHVSMEAFYQAALSGGDDYELCFTIPAKKETALLKVMQTLSCECHCIGAVEAEVGLRIVDSHDQLIALQQKGFQHF